MIREIGSGNDLTYGDGSDLNPGCDLDDNGLYDDSRLWQAKKALQDTISAFGQAEFALARYQAVDGGQSPRGLPGRCELQRVSEGSCHGRDEQTW